ncbi:MAG: HpcH/HpaI aldolase/citrate lyase family protein [Halothiobacillaceae bacterium]|nr:HpcH/HpaI aldolase/citrate lyase family protein [Halothiobacillaceae bacterium]
MQAHEMPATQPPSEGHLAERLGASLYVPCTHSDLALIAEGNKYPFLRSVIFCTEDAVSERDLPDALDNLAHTLARMPAHSPTLRFVRVRNIAVMQQVLSMLGNDKLDGFVIPKATRHNIESYLAPIQHTQHLLMPTLETHEVFCEREMRMLRKKLSAPHIKPRILALRIGGNDLLALLGIRRPRHVTIYRTPLGGIIARLVTTMRPHGFHLTAPVFEHMDRQELLAEEVNEDLLHGLIGKTAIHPHQVPLIESHYRVCPNDVQTAQMILQEHSPAVFGHDGSMCEVSTHKSWAKNILTRVQAFGAIAT